jgi:predicted  nucleic acid-binding Zn-ribbon protein
MHGTIKAVTWDKHQKSLDALEHRCRVAEDKVRRLMTEREALLSRAGGLEAKVGHLQNEVNDLQRLLHEAGDSRTETLHLREALARSMARQVPQEPTIDQTLVPALCRYIIALTSPAEVRVVRQ